MLLATRLIRGSRARTGVLIVTVTGAVCAALFGASGVGVAYAVLALPVIAWVFDTSNGTLSILTTLVVIVILIMTLLIALMALAR